MSTRVLILFATLSLVLFEARGQCEGSVTYRVSNVCNWTSKTHPTDYPSNAHFSPLCGTAHSADYTMFEEGGISTEGVREVAETGDCGLLEGEIDDCMMSGFCAVDGFFSRMCDTSLNPEGVGNGVCTHSVNLCKKDETTGQYYWVDQYPADDSANLYAYDAGTDSGGTFLSEDAPVDPFDPIAIFNAMDASNIFYNQEEGVLKPMCQILLEKA